MESNRMSRVVVDAEKNRLNITLIGSICKEEVEKIFADVIVCVPELKPVFNVVQYHGRSSAGRLGRTGARRGPPTWPAGRPWSVAGTMARARIVNRLRTSARVESAGRHFASSIRQPTVPR